MTADQNARRCVRCGKGQYLMRYEQFDGRNYVPLCARCAVKTMSARVDGVEVLRNGRRIYPCVTREEGT